MSDGELLDAREAMSLLGVNETDLQTMVARGSLRAFRSAGTMKFRRDDVLGIKTEKKTEPTIVMGAAAQKAKPGSGILPTVSSSKSPRGSSRNLPAIKPSGAAAAAAVGTAAATAVASPRTVPAKPPVAVDNSSSDQIILEEFELAPAEGDHAANTQQVTASNPAVTGNATTVDAGIETGNQTVVEQGVDIDTASATASAIAPVVSSPTGSGRTRVPSGRQTDSGIGAAAPAMSRVRAAVSASSQSTTAKRREATAAARSASPVMTVLLTLTFGIYLYTATVVAVQLFKGNYDETTHQRVIPPFLSDAPVVNYKTAYANLPGTLDEEGPYKAPATELAPPGK